MSALRPPVKLLVTSLFCLAPLAAWAQEKAPHGPITLDRDIRPVLQQYCFDCHNPDKKKGDLNLVEIANNPELLQNRDVWSKVQESIENGDMPPDKRPRPSNE